MSDNTKDRVRIILPFKDIFILLTFLIIVFYQVRFSDLWHTCVREYVHYMRIGVAISLNACHNQ